VADLPQEAPVSRQPNPQQAAAIEARGRVFVAAGAGTGKTAVLVERYVRAVTEGGLDVESLLVITYTERAAGELRSRIRARLLEVGRPDLARALDGAWISTIHGFCRRLLAIHALAAGVDPGFRVLGEAQARVLQGEAFDDALADFCSVDEEERWRLLATYGAKGLRSMLVGVYDTLRSAGRPLVLEPAARPDLDALHQELRGAAAALVADGGATELQRQAAAAALALVEATTLPERLLELDAFTARGPRAASFNEAREALRAAALEELAARDPELLEELLVAFGEAYARAKDRESALDFEDLQLRVRDLLVGDEELRARERQRFRSVMVDEFQDTNRLQTELIDLLVDGDELDVFFVGDEFQSIYGFRHADVAVFRERREAAPAVLPLTLNYRSRPEVLAAVNELFAAEFGDDFLPLEAAHGPLAEPLRSAVELLVTDKAAATETGVNWRRSEARSVARRVRELVDSGVALPGEIVLLFAAGTDAEWYEEELRAVGLPTIRSAGKSYFGQQQVVDLVSYLRLLQNRYDDEALLTVLASPFVGVSNDALVLVRAAATRMPLFKGIERTLPDGLADDDRRLLRAFLQRYERLVELSEHASLELVCERILTEHDYDLAVLALPDGRRRYANLRKLARLARAYEELRGPDVEGFVRFIGEQQAVGARELDAVSEEEGADAVRLLTIHAAKGLEFKIVIVADAGRERHRADDILCLSDGRFGFKVAHPATGSRVGTTSYQDVRASHERAEHAERLRLYYVAMTRAMDRLLVSGSVDLASGKPESTPIRWVIDRLDLADELAAADGPIEVRRGEASILMRVDRGVPDAQADGSTDDVADAPEEHDETDAAEPGQLALFAGSGEELPPRAPRLHALAALPEPALGSVTRLSYSAISLFERCSYRFYVERVVGMRPAPWAPSDEGDGGGLHATEIGDAVHRLLERVDLATPVAPVELPELVRAWYPDVRGEELETIGTLVAAYCDSELATRVAGLAGAGPERPFAFEVDGVLLGGRLDVLWRDGPRALVLDYKTNALGDRPPAEIVADEYEVQRTVYALACLRAGVEEVEVVYQFLEAPADVVTRTFTAADAPGLEGSLRTAIRRIADGEFHPTPSPYACSGCPALDRVCAGPRLRSHPGALLEPTG
jgi:ATP-dependent exoDNAse (exonuclease V) beta subunit